MKISKSGNRTIITWNKEDAQDVQAAEGFFVKMIRQGWLAVRRNGELRRTLEFRPEYSEILFIPLSEGG